MTTHPVPQSEPQPEPANPRPGRVHTIQVSRNASIELESAHPVTGELRLTMRIGGSGMILDLPPDTAKELAELLTKEASGLWL